MKAVNMASEKAGSPTISIKLELLPDIFHFSDASPPTLSLYLTSNVDKPIAIQLGYGSPLDPACAMQHGAYPIADLSTVPPTPLKIQDLTGRVNRQPSQQMRCITILPARSTRINVAFTRGGSFESRFRPQPWEIVQRGRLLDEHGNETQARRSPVVCGCDGLQAGKRYKVTVATGKLIGRSWWWGTEEEVQEGTATVPLFTEDGEELRLPLNFEIVDGGTEFSVAV